ncbi:MAG TPA: hypothetical protein VLL52_08835 [Anaerolineae bacterium]|nr:hypothetical protein [Anaerolineae bacterium]
MVGGVADFCRVWVEVYEEEGVLLELGIGLSRFGGFDADFGDWTDFLMLVK